MNCYKLREQAGLKRKPRAARPQASARWRVAKMTAPGSKQPSITDRLRQPQCRRRRRAERIASSLAVHRQTGLLHAVASAAIGDSWTHEPDVGYGHRRWENAALASGVVYAVTVPRSTAVLERSLLYGPVRRPAVAGIIGGRRVWTASMISALSIPRR